MLGVQFQYQGYLIDYFAQHWKLETRQFLIAGLVPGSWVEDSVMIVLVTLMDVVVSQYRTFAPSAAARNPCNVSVPYPADSTRAADELHLKNLVYLQNDVLLAEYQPSYHDQAGLVLLIGDSVRLAGVYERVVSETLFVDELVGLPAVPSVRVLSSSNSSA